MLPVSMSVPTGNSMTSVECGKNLEECWPSPKEPPIREGGEWRGYATRDASSGREMTRKTAKAKEGENSQGTLGAVRAAAER